MAATIDGDITNQNVAAELEGYRLITRSDVAAVHHATLFGILLGQSLTVHHATTGDGNMFLSDGVDKTVSEIRMAAILVSRTFPRLCLIVCLHLGRSRQNLGTSRNYNYQCTSSMCNKFQPSNCMIILCSVVP